MMPEPLPLPALVALARGGNVIEDVTFGQGSYGTKCRLCGEDDYRHPGAIAHIDGCPYEQVQRLRP